MITDVLHVYRYVLYRFKLRVFIILIFGLLAQIGLLLSLLLPWQILQVLATGHSRVTFIWSMSTPALTQLIWLSLIITTSFLLYLWLNKYSKTLIKSLAADIVESLDKSKLMLNHQLIATVTMSVIIRSVSMILNSTVFTLIGLLIYPKLMIAVILYMIIIGAGIVIRYRQYEQKGEVVKLQEMLQQYILVFSNIGIAVAFSVIVYDYMQRQLPALFTIFMSVLVLRQALIAYINIYITLLGVIKRRRNINALFLSHEQRLIIKEVDQFEQQFYQDTLVQWLTKWIEARLDKIVCHHDSVQADTISPHYELKAVECVECKLMSRATIAYLVIKVSVGPILVHGTDEAVGKQGHSVLPPKDIWLLLKCYHPSKSSHASHEIGLLEAYAKGEVSCDIDTHITDTSIKAVPNLLPILYDHGHLPQGDYLLMSFHQGSVWLNSVERKAYLQSIRLTLASYHLPDGIIERMSKTQADLALIMREVNWQRLSYMTSSERQKYQLDVLMNQWETLTAAIKQLPKTLALDSLITPRVASYEGELTIYDWQGWLYDSLGRHWALSGAIDQEVDQIVSALRADQITIFDEYNQGCGAESLSKTIVLAAKLDEFCRRLHQKNDIGAMNMIQGILTTASS